MKSENIKKGFANNNKRSRGQKRGRKKRRLQKIQRKLQVPPVGDKKTTTMTGTRTRSENAK